MKISGLIVVPRCGNCKFFDKDCPYIGMDDPCEQIRICREKWEPHERFERERRRRNNEDDL